MEMTSFHSLSIPKLPKPLNYIDLSVAAALAFPVTSFPRNCTRFLGFKRKLHSGEVQLRSFGAINATKAEISSANAVQKWVFEPIGDGNTKHIGFKIGMPGPFEIASGAVTVGRVAEKADVVIPVPTVSAVHARIQKTEEILLVTDLDSTNGTFINEKRLRPGIAASASPGSKVTFGDTHLAIFRVSKIESVDATNESESEAEPEDKPDST